MYITNKQVSFIINEENIARLNEFFRNQDLAVEASKKELFNYLLNHFFENLENLKISEYSDMLNKIEILEKELNNMQNRHIAKLSEISKKLELFSPENFKSDEIEFLQIFLLATKEKNIYQNFKEFLFDVFKYLNANNLLKLSIQEYELYKHKLNSNE